MRGPIISHREDSVWIIDANCWPTLDLDCAFFVIQGLNETTGKTLKELIDDDLGDTMHTINGITENLVRVSWDTGREGMKKVQVSRNRYTLPCSRQSPSKEPMQLGTARERSWERPC